MTRNGAPDLPDSPSLGSAPPWHCPDHRVELRVENGHLVCPHDHRFPVVEEIPRFVPAESYSASFGAQWKRFRRTQLDSYTGVPLSRNRVRAVLGEALWSDLA